MFACIYPCMLRIPEVSWMSETNLDSKFWKWGKVSQEIGAILLSRKKNSGWVGILLIMWVGGFKNSEECACVVKVWLHTHYPAYERCLLKQTRSEMNWKESAHSALRRSSWNNCLHFQGWDSFLGWVVLLMKEACFRQSKIFEPEKRRCTLHTSRRGTTKLRLHFA